MLLRFPNRSPQLPWAIPAVQNGDYYVYRSGLDDQIKYVHSRAMNEGGVFAVVTPEQAGLGGMAGLSAEDVGETIASAAEQVVSEAQAEQQRVMTAVEEHLPESVELPAMPSWNARQVGVMGLIALGALLGGNLLHRMGV